MKLPPFFLKGQSLLWYGICLAMLLFALKWLEIRLLFIDMAFEIYAGSIAIIFTALGIWLALKLSKPKTVVIEKEIIIHAVAGFSLDQAMLQKLAISKRELDVLQLISAGLSNREIAERLFVSLNTVKTHLSNLFDKLEVKSRTRAIEKAKRLSLIP